MFRQSGSSTFVETDLEKLKELAKQEALKQTAAERDRILQDAVRTSQQLQLVHIKRTPVTRNGKRVILSDVQSNGSILETLLNPGEEISLEWFLAHCQESAFDRLSWEDWLSPTQRKAQEEKIAQALHEQALDKIQRFNLKNCEANLKALTEHPGDDIVLLPDGPVLLTDNEDPIIELIPASQQELQERHRQHLITLRKNNDIAGLRRAAAENRAATSQNLATLHRDYSLLKGFATRQEYLLPPLPPTWNGRPLDATRIKQGGREIISQIGKKHGFERINAVLYGLDESFFSNWANKLRDLEFQLGVRTTTH